MPGFLGGSGSGGTGGITEFVPAAEFIDPVTKIRVSEPETLIDTDFEYGLQPTKWETVELINNTPSFFSKSGDTTIPNIISMTTIAGSREVTVTTSLDHGLSIGIPISVKGTKSLTADGSYIVGSIPNSRSFTYLAKVNQATTRSINDLYTVVITGEFFQGSQIRISDSGGIEVDSPEGESFSVLTVKTESPHGFGVNTPLYFLNLNSTISQEFDASNTQAKSFDSSNSSTAQTFDGSNSASQLTYDLSNNGTRFGGSPSSVTGQNTTLNTITVAHGSESFNNLTLGQPLYHNVTTSAGYFATNPRGVVFIKNVSQVGIASSTFTVSAIPNGDEISIEATISGTFQIANQARLFAGNNINPETEISLDVIEDSPKAFDGSNTLGDSGTVTSFSGSLITITSDSGDPDLSWKQNTMILYTTNGSAASGLTNNTTYWVDTIFQQGSTNTYSFTIKPEPTASAITSISGGTGTQQFKKIGISVDKEYFYIEEHGYKLGDMLRYEYPESGRFSATGGDAGTANFYYLESVPNNDNFRISRVLGGLTVFDGSTSQLAATNATSLKQTSDTYNLALPNGVYWINYRGTPMQMYCDLTGTEAGSTQPGWMRIDTNFINTYRLSAVSEVRNSYNYVVPGRYNGVGIDNRIRMFRWLLPIGTRGIRITQVQYNCVNGPETNAKQTNATTLFNASNGTSLDPGANVGQFDWVGLASVAGSTRPITNAAHTTLTSGQAGIRNADTTHFQQFDDVGFNLDRLMMYHADGATEIMETISYTIWIK